MKEDRRKELLDFVANLNLKERCEVINMITLSSDCSAFVGSLSKHMISSEIDHACLNGLTIQVNLKLAELDDLSDDSFVSSALDRHLEKLSSASTIN